MTIQVNAFQVRTPQLRAKKPVRPATDVLIGVDLTVLGAARSARAQAFYQHASLSADSSVHHMSFPTLASASVAAIEGGIDFVSLSQGFVTRSDHQGEVGKLDPAKTAGRLLQHANVGMSVRVPTTLEAFDQSLALIDASMSSNVMVEISATDIAHSRDLLEYIDGAHNLGIKVCVYLEAQHADAYDLPLIASCADVVRLASDDPHEAREVRFALRSAAAEFGRELKVVCELGVVISSTRRAAEERLILLSMMGDESLKNKACAHGTVADVADEVERWLSAGAADGVIFLPASLPTDLASLIRGVLPALRARHVAISS